MNSPPEVKINPVSAMMQGSVNFVMMSEGAAIDSVLAHVTVRDVDGGMNGIVSCHSLNPYFAVSTLTSSIF